MLASALQSGRNFDRRSLAGGESNFRPQVKNKLFLLLALLMTAATGAMAQDYYAPSTDEVIILNEVYNASNSGYSSHSAIAWGGTASTNKYLAGDPNNGGQSTSSTVRCYSVKGDGRGKNITLSITGVSKVIVYHENSGSRYIELRDGSKEGNIIGSGQTSTYYTEVALTATNEYSIFLHGTDGLDDQTFYVYAIKLIAAAAPTPAATGYTVTLAEGTEDAENWTIEPNAGLNGGETVTITYNGSKRIQSVTAVKKTFVTAIELNKTATTIAKGSNETLSITAVTPDNADDKTVTWSSDKENIATVDANGKVTAVAVGTANITATANDGSGVKATCAVTVTLAYPVALSAVTADCVGSVVCSDGNVYAKVSDATTAGKTAVAMIAYIGSGTDHASYKHGLAIALSDESSSNWSTAKSTCEGKTAVTGAAWLLPSQNQWKAMFNANGGSYSGLNTAITTAGGTALQESNRYWSSKENGGDKAYFVYLSGGDAHWNSYSKDSGQRVRACLAF